MRKPSNLTVKQSEPPLGKEILAEAIVKISAALNTLQRSGLNEDAIIVLLKDSTGISKADIGTLFRGLAELRRNYCR